MFKGRTPDKGTKEYNRNEKIINNTGMLKKARDQSEGFNTANKTYSNTGAGKGSSQRPTNHEAYSDNWDRIFGKKEEK
jgi:hypothetical protein